MGWKDKLMEGLDKAKEAAQSGLEKVQEKHEENQRIKNLPCAVCGEPVGGYLFRRQLDGEDTYICASCWDQLPRSMKEYEKFERFAPEDIIIGKIFSETYTEHFTVESTDFCCTDSFLKIACDTEKGLFLVADHNIGKVFKPGPKTEVFKFDWLMNPSIEMASPFVSRHSKTGEIQHVIGQLVFDFDIVLPGSVPSGLSIDIPMANKVENHRIVLDSQYGYELERKVFSNKVGYHETETVKQLREWFMNIWRGWLEQRIGL